MDLKKRKKVILISLSVLVPAILYAVFLYPRYPAYEELPGYPPPPSRSENAFKEYYEAASLMEPDEEDFQRAFGAIVETATAGFPLSATLPAFYEDLNRKYADALVPFREGTLKKRCHVYLEYYDLEFGDLQTKGTYESGGFVTGLFMKSPEGVGAYSEDEWMKEGRRSTEIKGNLTQSLLLLGIVEALGAVVIADASGIKEALPRFDAALRAANHVEEDHVHFIWGFGSIFREETTACMARLALKEGIDNCCRPLLEFLMESRSRIRPMTREHLLAVSSPLLEGVMVGRFFRDEMRAQIESQFEILIAQHKVSRVTFDLLLLRVALEAFRIERGAWPENLSDLSTIIGGDLPTDPFSGKSYMLIFEDGKPYLYSLGPDGTDQRGETIWNPNSGIESKGDIIEHWDKYFSDQGD